MTDGCVVSSCPIVTTNNVPSTGFVCRRCLAGLEATRSSKYSSVCKQICGGIVTSVYRTAYFFIQESPLQFKVCGVFQLSIDCGA